MFFSLLYLRGDSARPRAARTREKVREKEREAGFPFPLLFHGLPFPLLRRGGGNDRESGEGGEAASVSIDGEGFFGRRPGHDSSSYS